MEVQLSIASDGIHDNEVIELSWRMRAQLCATGRFFV